MTSASEHFHASKGTVLFRPDDACRGLVRLSAGTIRVQLTAANGRELVLYRVRPGDVCLQTLSCLVDGRPYRAEGVAETDLEGEIVPRADFPGLMAEDDTFRGEILAAVSRRFGEFEALVEDIALLGFDARLARALLRLADADGRIEATHQQLAAETASGRAAISRRLGTFAASGLVNLARGAVEIADRAALEQVAAGQM